jgi:hypothetical protein
MATRSGEDGGETMIGWAALITAVAALVIAVRKSEGWQTGQELVRMAQPAARPPVETATPEQFGHVELGGPRGGEVAIRRYGAQHDEILTAGGYLSPGQLVRIDGDTAYPTPDREL